MSDDTAEHPTAADALFTLTVSIGSAGCDLCVCDVDGSGTVTVVDAQKTLSAAVAGLVELSCPPCVAECGDGLVDEAQEECDDGNSVNRDACTNDCHEAVCGDGIVFNRGGGTEECDDGNNVDGDGCSTQCLVELACADVSGRWNSHGDGRVCCTIDGQRDCENLEDARGTVNVQQTECSLRIYEEMLGFDLTIYGDATESSVVLYSELIPVPGLDCVENYLVSDGVLDGDDRIEFAIDGAADCIGETVDGERVRVQCSASGNDVWTR